MYLITLEGSKGLQGSLLFIVIAVIVVLFIAFAFFTTFIKRHRVVKQVRELEKKYENIHTLLIGQDSAFLKRIYAISNYNLLYSEVYTKHLKEYEELTQTEDEQARNALSMLKTSLDRSKTKHSRENFKRNKEILLKYFTHVENFSNNLKKLLVKEEEAKEKSLSQKEAIRNIKNLYYQHQSELRLVEDSFTVLFENIDEAFRRYDDAIDHADYESVNTILKRIDGALKELRPIIETLPLLCAKLNDVLPNKIAVLKDKSDEMVSEGYPLNHLHINQSIESFEARIENVKNHLKALNISGCDEEIDNIIAAITDIMDKISQEKYAKESYESNIDNVTKQVKVLEDKFIKIYNVIPDISAHYIIEEKYLNEVDVIQFNISKIGNVKRTLDNYIHSLSKQPYSLLDSKCSELKELTKFASMKLNEFSTYLLSLEDDYNDAVDAIKNGYVALKKAKSLVHEFHLVNYELAQEEKFDELFKRIDEINLLLKIQPINVKEINELILRFEDDKDELIKIIENNNNFATVTESLVVYANRYRHHSSEIANLFTQIEMSFFDGEFERAYMDAGNATKKIRNTAESAD
ncbi:MAG: hypothetical protein J1F32_06935 [Erysipelotrichales bacterium]|nr:hypothetical protein [Erysipelotrichales bacterium]